VNATEPSHENNKNNKNKKHQKTTKRKIRKDQILIPQWNESCFNRKHRFHFAAFVYAFAMTFSMDEAASWHFDQAATAHWPVTTLLCFHLVGKSPHCTPFLSGARGLDQHKTGEKHIQGPNMSTNVNIILIRVCLEYS